jgi:TolA-binding protein
MRRLFDYINVPVTLASIVVSIVVTIIAIQADEAIRQSTERIEAISQRIDSLTNRMNLAIARMEPLVVEIDSRTSAIAKRLEKEKLNGEIPVAKNPDSPVTAQDSAEWEKGYRLMKEGKYIDAIEQFEKIIGMNADYKKDAYYGMAMAYARLLKQTSGEDKIICRQLMLQYLKQSARLGNAKAQEVLKSNGED